MVCLAFGESSIRRQGGILAVKTSPSFTAGSISFQLFSASESSLCDVTHADIVPGFKTDHSMITLNARFVDYFPRITQSIKGINKNFGILYQ